jgi:predicted DNA-binding ribbon-helix-helix protein
MNRRLQKSRNAKRSVIVGRHKTSVSLEDAFWKSLHDIAVIKNTPLSDLLSAIDTGREQGSLSSAIRVFVLNHYRTQDDRRPDQLKPHDEASAHEPGR